MYRDCDHVSIDIVNSSSPQDVNIQVTKAKSEGYTVMRLATYLFPDDMWKFLTHGSLCGTWAHVPYFQAGVNPVYMRSKFKVIRDTVRENNLMKLLGLENTEYIFVHNDPRHTLIDTSSTKYKVVCPDPTITPFNMFDWLGVIENAKEVHCMNSGYVWVVELCNIGSSLTNFLHLKNAHTEYSPSDVMNVFTDALWTFKE